MKDKIKNIIIKILTWEAKALLARHKPRVVAITGSVGKTGTKDAVAAALGAEYSVRKSPKSFNSEFGLPLTVLGLPNAWGNLLLWAKTIIIGFWRAFFGKEYEEILVLEVGADHPGDIAKVAQWLKADVVVITAVPEVPVHREYYSDSGAVLREKSQLVNALIDDGLLITGDDERVVTIDNGDGKVLRVTYDLAEVLYKDAVPVGMEFNIGESKVRALGVLGSHQAYAAAFALAVAAEFGVDKKEAISALENMERTPGRMRLLSGKGSTVIIDDSYNSSPLALKAALEALSRLNIDGKKVAILGDMKELGDVSDREHRRAGAQVAHVANELYTIGEQAKLLAASAIEEGLPDGSVHMYSEGQASKIGKAVAQELVAGDVVLVKGSQGGIRLEKAVKELIQDSNKAGRLLVRQDAQWLRR